MLFFAQESLPYGGQDRPNSGFSGSEASEQRARSEDASGVTSARQRAVLRRVEGAGFMGRTWREIGQELGLHHGQASASLSNLHKTGRIARLKMTRQRCSIYVGLSEVHDRDTSPPGQTSTTALLDDMAELLGRFNGECDHIPVTQEGCIHCETKEVLRRYEARHN